jgi:hypothetical protein
VASATVHYCANRHSSCFHQTPFARPDASNSLIRRPSKCRQCSLCKLCKTRTLFSYDILHMALTYDILHMALIYRSSVCLWSHRREGATVSNPIRPLSQIGSSLGNNYPVYFASLSSSPQLQRQHDVSLRLTSCVRACTHCYRSSQP